MNTEIKSAENALVIPKGYKQTEVGIIPEDWGISNLGSVCNLINGRGFKPYEWSQEGLPIIRIQNLNGSDEYNYFNGDFNNKILINNGQLLFAWSGSRGTSFGPHIWFGNDALLNYHTWKIVIKNDDLDSSYFFYSLKEITKIIEESAHGASALVHTQMGEMKKFYIPLPNSIEEQTAIANALSGVDALLCELEKLIAKKQAIKTATMQQLLTGKTRLPAFAVHSEPLNEGSLHEELVHTASPHNTTNHTENMPKGQRKGTKPSELGEIPEDWEVVNFGGLFEKSITRKKIAPENDISFVGMQDVSEEAQLRSPSKIAYKTVKSGFTYFERNDVLIAKITPCFENGKGCFTDILPTEIGFGSTEFHVLRATKNASPKYIYYITVTDKFRKELESEMVGSAGHRRVPFCAIQNYRIAVSKEKKEQTAIANILSDMDSEIQALTQRLAKTRQIKQGMMQALLTGKIRLPFEKTQVNGVEK